MSELKIVRCADCHIEYAQELDAQMCPHCVDERNIKRLNALLLRAEEYTLKLAKDNESALSMINKLNIEIASYKAESKYQYREIGESDWHGCTKEYFSFCEGSAEYDTTIKTEIECPKHTTGGGPCYCGLK